MIRLLLTTAVVFTITTFYSCQKCTTCTREVKVGNPCVTCTFNFDTIDICESELIANGYDNINQFINAIESLGGNCTQKGGTPADIKTEKLCWTDNTSKNTAILARVSLQGQGYDCAE